MEVLIIIVAVLALLTATLTSSAPYNAKSGAAGAANQGCGCLMWLVLAGFALLLLLGLAGVQEVNINAHPAAPGIELRR